MWLIILRFHSSILLTYRAADKLDLNSAGPSNDYIFTMIYES